MKYLIAALLVFTFMTFGCKKSTTEPNDNINGNNIHATVNVKNASEYFNFSINSGSSNPASAYDVEFYAVRWNPTGAPPEIIIDDPRFRSNDGLSIAVLNDTKLEDVVDVPVAGEFVTNFLSEEGEWYYTTPLNIVLPYDHVYIVNTTDGKFPAFQIISYYDDMGESGVFNIEWKYLSE